MPRERKLDVTKEQILLAAKTACSITELFEQLNLGEYRHRRSLLKLSSIAETNIAEIISMNKTQHMFDNRAKKKNAGPVVCKECGAVFTSKYSKDSSGLFCSKECARRYSSSRSGGLKNTVCQLCGTAITVDRRTSKLHTVCTDCRKLLRQANDHAVQNPLHSKLSDEECIKLGLIKVHCACCAKEFYSTSHRIYCSEECYSRSRVRKRQPRKSSTDQNTKVYKELTCLNCGKTFKGYNDRKYCSKVCAAAARSAQRAEYIEKSGGVGLSEGTVRGYLLKKHSGACDICGTSTWLGKPIMLIMDHINGRANDNRFENLRFICSNCDATLPTYKSKNKHSDRRFRTKHQYTGVV